MNYHHDGSSKYRKNLVGAVSELEDQGRCIEGDQREARYQCDGARNTACYTVSEAMAHYELKQEAAITRGLLA